MPPTAGDVGQVFERSPLLVSRLLPLVDATDSPREIVRKAREIISAFDEQELIATLAAHPRIGDDPRTLSALSLREQGADADPEALRELADLNAAYERRFGFRFVVFVAGRHKSEIVPLLRARLERTREEELATNVNEFLAISRDRLEKAQPGG